MSTSARKSKPRRKQQTVTAPVAVSQKQVNVGPQTRVSKRGMPIIKHREFITTVSGITAGTFTVNGGLGDQLYTVQPMNAPSFNWLLGVAAHFDQYRMLSVKMQYTPLCASTEVGRVALFWDPDSQDSGPSDRMELTSYHGSVDTPPWSPVTMRVPCDQKVRLLEDNPTADSKLLDMGRVGYATYGTTTTNSLGDIFLEYEVELIHTQPMANLTRFGLGTATVLTSIVGPRYFDVSALTGTFTTITFLATGTYQVFHITTGTTTSHSTPIASNGGIVTGFSQTGSATKSMSTYTVTAPSSTVQVQMPFTGSKTNFNIWAFRSGKATASTI